MKHSFALFATRRFLPLFVTQFFGAFNDNAFKNAFLIWFTYDVAVRTGQDASMMVALAAGLFILPFFLLSATAGQIADKYERSWLVRRIKLVEIVLMVAISAAFFLESVPFLLFLLFLMGAQSTFFGPIKYSLLPEHLHKDELIAGNGFVGGGTFLAILLGTIFGGLVVRMENGMAWIAAALILFSVMGWWGSRFIPLAKVGDTQLRIGWNIFRETWRIIGYAREERTVWLSILGISWFWLVGATFLTQFPIHVREVVGGNEKIVTLFLTLFSVGIGMGAVLCNRLLRGEINGRYVPYGALGMCIFIADFYWSGQLYQATLPAGFPDFGVADFLSHSLTGWRLVVDLLLIAVCGGIYIVPLYAIMQSRTAPVHLARVVAANNVMNACFMVLASVLTILLYTAGLTVNQLFLAVGVMNIPVWWLIRHIVKRRLGHA